MEQNYRKALEGEPNCGDCLKRAEDIRQGLHCVHPDTSGHLVELDWTCNFHSMYVARPEERKMTCLICGEKSKEIEAKIDKLTSRLVDTLFQVKIKGIRPTKDELIENEFSGADLFDLIILLCDKSFEYEKHTSFWEAWNATVKMSTVSELMDGLGQIKEHQPVEGYADDEYQQVYDELLTRQPFQLIKSLLDSLDGKVIPLLTKIDEVTEGLNPELVKFKDWTYHMFDWLVTYIGSKHPEDKELLELIRKMSINLTGYKP